MTCREQNKILDAKIESNVNQYKVDRLNAEISAFSSGDLNKYEFLKRIDLNNKPSALDKAKFEFSSLGQTFNIGLDKNAQGYQEEGIIKLLKDIRDGLAGNVIIPARPPRPDNNGNDNNGNDDNGNDNNGNDNNGNDDHGNDNNGNDNNGNDNNGNDDNGYDNNGNDNNGNDDNENDDHGNDNNGNDNNGNDNNGNDDNRNDDNNNNGNDNNGNDLSWMNDLQLYKKIALEVFSRYNEDKNSFELFTLRTFIDNINNERVKNKKDAREEFKNVKKNVKSVALKEIVKDLEQAIFGDDDNDESLIEGLDKDILEQEELDTRFKNLISKKRRESLREHLEESKDANPQGRAKASKKKINDLFKTISEDNDDSKNNNNNNDNDDSEDNQISNFVDEVLKKVNDDAKKLSKGIVNDDAKKVSKEIVNDDAEKVSKEIVNDDAKKKSNQKSKKNITEEIKEIKEIIELDKKIYGIKS